jgi:hypothetical protein
MSELLLYSSEKVYGSLEQSSYWSRMTICKFYHYYILPSPTGTSGQEFCCGNWKHAFVLCLCYELEAGHGVEK